MKLLLPPRQSPGISEPNSGGLRPPPWSFYLFWRRSFSFGRTTPGHRHGMPTGKMPGLLRDPARIRGAQGLLFVSASFFRIAVRCSRRIREPPLYAPPTKTDLGRGAKALGRGTDSRRSLLFSTTSPVAPSFLEKQESEVRSQESAWPRHPRARCDFGLRTSDLGHARLFSVTSPDAPSFIS